MNLRFSFLFALVIVFTLATPISRSAAAVATAPTVYASRGKVVFVKVPPGYESVTLWQKTGSKTKPSKVLGTKPTDLAGGSVSFLLKTAVARTALYVIGVRAVPSRSSVGAGIESFPADPALSLSGGFTGVGASMTGIVSMAADTNRVTLASSVSAPATRDVVESDIWRVAGDRLYFFNELRGLQVFDVSNPDDPALLGQLRVPNHGEQMYLLDSNHVALLTRPSNFLTIYSSMSGANQSLAGSGSGAVVISDVSNGRPTEIGRVEYPGYLVESRLVGTALYVVSAGVGATQSGLQVTSFDLSDPAHPAQVATLSLGSYGGVVTATDRFLFVVRYADTWRHSTIDVIDISAPNGALRKRGKIEAAGVVGDKFKMNLAGDTLTIVSAVPRDWSADPNDPANASRTVIENFSLARPATPVRLGSLTVGVGESVRATRFADGRLYVVTFFTIDPLWVIDLADPRNPTLLGELEVPGFSTYLEPLGDRLVAVGRVGSQTAVSLFDVSDPAQPRQLSQIPLGAGYSTSEANWDEKAFSVLPGENLILVPYSGYDSTSGWANRVQLIDLRRDDLQVRGVVDQGFAARRTAIVHDRILAISSSDLVTVNFSDRDHPVVTSDVEIAWRVDRVFIEGNHLVQVGGEAGRGGTTAPAITISPSGDPDQALTVFALEDVPVVGATVRDGRLYLAQQAAAVWGRIFYLEATSSPPTAPVNPLIVSVFDLTHLPAITRLGRTEATIEPTYGYGTAELEAAWPDAGTLVWVRPQWTSWWWGGPVILARPMALNGSGALNTITTTADLGMTILPAGNLTLGATSLPLVRSATATADLAASSLAINSSRLWIPPWYRTSSGHELLVFDVRTPSAPVFAAELDVRSGQTGDWSAPLALDGKLYLSYLSHETATTNTDGAASRNFRHFLKRVDFADVTHPAIGPEVNLPGRLLAVEHGGATLLTVGCGFDADGLPTGRRVFHSSSFDGTAARLIDQLETPAANDPYALDGATLLLGTWPLGAGQPAQLQAWRLDGEGKFVLADTVNAPAFTSLATVRGLLVGFGSQAPRLFDVSDPANLVDLPNADTRQLTGGSLDRAAGGAGQGIWQPLGDYGVGVVTLP